MEKSSNMKEEIYKIVKYQTKLAESVSRDQQDLYRHKLTQHITNLTNHGVRKEAIGNMLRGGSIVQLLEEQKNATMQALQKLEESSQAGIDDLKAQQERILGQTTDVVKKHESLATTYKSDAKTALTSMEDINVRASNLETKAFPKGSLEQLSRDIDELLKTVKEPTALAKELSEELAEAKKQKAPPVAVEEQPQPVEVKEEQVVQTQEKPKDEEKTKDDDKDAQIAMALSQSGGRKRRY